MDHFGGFLALGLGSRDPLDPCDRVVHVRKLPLPSEIEAELGLARDAAKQGEALRRRYRRRTARGYHDRREALDARIETLSRHSAILRSYGRFSESHKHLRRYLHRIQRVMAALRAERRKLTKML